MGRDGLITPEEAEQAIWSFYWQLDQARDRRSPNVGMTDEEITERQLKEAKIKESMWRRLYKHCIRVFTPSRQKDVIEGVSKDAQDEYSHFLEGQPGRLHSKTGLPVNEAELGSGRAVVTGIRLCLGAIVSPGSLAEACTLSLEPCPPGESAETWGSELSHWRAMMYKSRDEWTEEESRTVDHNTIVIKRKIHELAEEGYFNTRPISPSDREMHDLVWEDEAGMTVGFKMEYEGYKRMQEVCNENPELQRYMHLLEVAGEEVRESAPEWVKRDHERGGKPEIAVESGGFNVEAGGFTTT